jgi:pyridoxal phosphate enzyme (YggS family)
LTREFEAVKSKIAAVVKDVGRDEGSVDLIAVSKTKSVAEIIPILEAGQRIFGENKVQESSEKWPALKEKFDGIELHLIGPLQSNKVRQAVKIFEVIETLDRLKLARALARIFKEEQLSCDLYIQINTGSEPQKAGILPENADEFIMFCHDELNLPIIGLMCIPPAGEDAGPHFKTLKEMAQKHGLKNLSMGMTKDYDLAIAEGATHVRLGTAIFGARNYL